MNYREMFIDRYLDVLGKYAGTIPAEVRHVQCALNAGTLTPSTMTNQEYNVLYNFCQPIIDDRVRRTVEHKEWARKHRQGSTGGKLR